MIGMFLTNSTLAFDLYGDIQLENNDLKINKDLRAVLQILADYLKTNYKDYEFYDKYGSNYDIYIGRGITQSLVNEVENKIKKDLLSLGLVPDKALDVAALQTGNNTIEVRVFLYGLDDYTLYIKLDKSEGILIDY